ncbi:MAG: hypothetical protein O7G85_07610, partial [Planctomycetota bacterium]|nr:hypothetical protein [Planctomycetota bacterium]
MTMGLKRMLRPAVDQLARFTGQLRQYEHAMKQGVTILMYHRVLEDKVASEYPLATLAMPLRAFGEQMRWLSEHAQVMTLSRALASLE